MLLFSSIVSLSYSITQNVSLQNSVQQCACHLCIASQVEKLNQMVRTSQRDAGTGILQVHYKGLNLTFYDSVTRGSISGIINELECGEYPLEQYQFKSGDVVVDVGAHVGIVAIILAKMHPEITIYAVEPCPTNFKHLVQNIALNKVNNIHPFNVVMSDKTGNKVPFYDFAVADHAGYSASSSCFSPGFACLAASTRHDLFTMSLDDFFEFCSINSCRLLKIDCEGSEYDILYKSEKFKQSAVKDIVGEFHKNGHLTKKKYFPEELIEYCKKYVTGDVTIRITSIPD